ncbi:MAG: ABC transporter substrate-binding protein [Phycisphaerae bacterium]|nr:ABC transporter substrate-binding protein [Phycisphaerae bacterium]
MDPEPTGVSTGAAASNPPAGDDGKRVLRIGHSPDPDDAFMWYPLADFPSGSGPGGGTYQPCVDTGPYRFQHVLEDIESLNQRSARGELEITALSIHQYPYVADRYVLTSCGASMGDGYGPMVVARQAMATEKIPEVSLAIPGERTSAFLTLQLLLRSLGIDRPLNYRVVPFDRILDVVGSGECDAGLIIHEGQLTYGHGGLVKVVDLGEWWGDRYDLPLPLGGNAIRRDLGEEMGDICRILRASIDYALAHRQAAVDYALNYARDLGRDLADRFIGMYVNDYTLDYGARGREAVQRLLCEAAVTKLIPDPGEIDFISPT